MRDYQVQREMECRMRFVVTHRKLCRRQSAKQRRKQSWHIVCTQAGNPGCCTAAVRQCHTECFAEGQTLRLVRVCGAGRVLCTEDAENVGFIICKDTDCETWV